MTPTLSIEELKATGFELQDKVAGRATSPQFYAQAGAILLAVVLARIAAGQMRKRVGLMREPVAGDRRFSPGLNFVHSLRDLLFPVLAVLFLAIAIQACLAVVGSAWLVRIAQSIGVVGVLYAAINRFNSHPQSERSGQSHSSTGRAMIRASISRWNSRLPMKVIFARSCGWWTRRWPITNQS